MTSPLISTPRRRFATVGAVAGLCLFAWWAVQPVGPACPEGLSLSSDPYGSTYDPSGAAKGSGSVEYEGTYVPLEGVAPSPGGGAVSAPDAAFGSGGDDPCEAVTRHPRLYGWVGM